MDKKTSTADDREIRGVILAGGRGTRLLPATKIMNKHLVPILNQPMILYPLGTLKILGVKDILIVSGGEHIGGFAEFLGDGSEFGVDLTYRVQKDAGGIAQALGLAEDFMRNSAGRIATILGDNIFNNTGLALMLDAIVTDDSRQARIFVKDVSDPQRFGVLYRDELGRPSRIEEKPVMSRSREVVVGLYIYPADVFDVVSALKPSARGELEITDVNNYYLGGNRCAVTQLRDVFWSDAGTPESMAVVTQWASKNNK
jgi:glucose-1-phosphate thymidylyltransferase